MKNFIGTEFAKRQAKAQVDTALSESFLNHQKAFRPVLDQIEGLNITTADKFKYIKKFCDTQTTDPTLTVQIMKESVDNYPKFNQPMDDLINHTAKLWNDLPCVKTADTTIIQNSGTKLYDAMNAEANLTSFLGNSLQQNSPYKLEDIRTGLSNAIQEGDLPNLIDICTLLAKNEKAVVLLSTGGLASLFGIVLVVATNLELETGLRNTILSAIHTKKCQINRIQFNGSWDVGYQLLKSYFITQALGYVSRSFTPLTAVLFGPVINTISNYLTKNSITPTNNNLPNSITRPQTAINDCLDSIVTVANNSQRIIPNSTTDPIHVSVRSISNKIGYYIGDIFFSFGGGVKKAFFLQVVELAQDVKDLKNIDGLPTSEEEAKT
jgi:hypothetical protein